MKKYRIVFTILSIYWIMSFFCDFTPLVFDDYYYGAGGANFLDMMLAQIQEHQKWSGKFIGHFMARVLLHGPSWLHPILSPLAFIGVIISGVVLTLGIRWRDTIRDWHLILMVGLVWFALPAFGTVYFWRTGTPDYGYSLFFATFFLIPYRFWIDKKDFQLPVYPLFIFAGLFAGWSNENLGMLVILCALGTTLYRFRTLKRVPLWSACGIIGALSGWLLMMTAPGNTIRLEHLGGPEKIPLLSIESFNRFLVFWGSQQLEMVPYILVSLACLLILHKHQRLNIEIIMPGLIFLFLSQVSLAAFVLSPSTPYRAMTATYFFQACSCFAFIVNTDLNNYFSKLSYAVFCAILLFSVIHEINTFIQAQPAIAQRNVAMGNGTITAKSFDYPRTDKYFFPTYDIIEINAYSDAKKYQMIPWGEAFSLEMEGLPSVKCLVISNMVYLDNLPQGKIHVGALAHRQTLTSIIQSILRYISPLGETATSPEVTFRYAVASTTVNKNGRAILHIPGVTHLDDIAYLGIEEDHKKLVWRRIRK